MRTATEVQYPRRSTRERTGDGPDTSDRLHIDVDRGGPAVTIYGRGELDAYTLPRWRSVMRAATAPITLRRPVVVDISRLDFVACGALVALALDSDVCQVHGVDLVLVTCGSTVPRAVAAAGLADRLPIYSSLETALLAVAPDNTESVSRAGIHQKHRRSVSNHPGAGNRE